MSNLFLKKNMEVRWWAFILVLFVSAIAVVLVVNFCLAVWPFENQKHVQSVLSPYVSAKDKGLSYNEKEVWKRQWNQEREDAQKLDAKRIKDLEKELVSEKANVMNLAKELKESKDFASSLGAEVLGLKCENIKLTLISTAKPKAESKPQDGLVVSQGTATPNGIATAIPPVCLILANPKVITADGNGEVMFGVGIAVLPDGRAINGLKFPPVIVVPAGQPQPILRQTKVWNERVHGWVEVWISDPAPDWLKAQATMARQ